MRVIMPTDKKKVFLIVTESFDIGGLETRIKVEVIAMLKAGHKVHLACGENFNDSLLPKGLASVTSHLKLSAQATSLDLLASVNSIRNIITKNSVDYLIAHPFSSLLPSVIAAQLENIPCAITLHGPLSVGEMFGPIYEFIFFSIIIPSSSLIIAVSDEVKDLVTPHLGDRPIYVSPNTIDFNEFSPSPNELASNDGRWILVSRLDEAKITGIFDFIKKAKAAGISKIVVVGDGAAKPTLVDKLQANNLSNLVEFTGFRTDINILMQNAHGVAGMGRVALEGMASKKAVCLVGYDGVKGFVDNDLFEAAKYSNFSGRNLSIVNEKLFNTQYKKINQQNINLIYNKSKLENSSIQQVANLTNQFVNITPIKGGMLSDIYAYLKSDLIPNNIPILSSNVFFEKIGRLIFSKQYYNADLSSNYAFHQKKLDDFTKDNVAYYFRAQVEQKLSGIQSELQGSAEKIGGLISKQKNQEDFEQAWQAKSAEDQAVQIENQEKLQTKLEILSNELAAAAQNKIEQIQIAAKREREHQQVISHLQTETLHLEQAWQSKVAEDQAMQLANQEKLQTKLEILSDELAAAQQNKIEQIQIAAKREREHQQVISHIQTESLQREQGLQAKSNQDQAVQLANQAALQSELEAMSYGLTSAQQNKIELIQISAKREREHQQAISNMQAENLLSERAWQAKSSEVHALQIAMQAENLQREQIWQTKSDNLQLSYNEVQAGLQNEINNLQHKIVLIEQKNYEQKLENAHQFYVTKDWQDLAINIKNETDILLKSKFWKLTSPFRFFRMSNSKLNELSYAIHNYSLKQSTPSTNSDLILNRNEFANLSVSDSNSTTTLTLQSRETMNNIQDLLALYGEDFLNESYRIILGRKADPQGLKHYLSMLNIGTSKLEMLLQLSRSKEAKKYNANFPGLNNAISRHRLSKLPFMGWLVSSTDQMGNKLRVIENRLFEINNLNTTARIEQFEAQIIEKNHYIEDKEIYIAQLLLNISKPNSSEQSKHATSLLSDDLIIITGVPFDDVGGGQRAAQIARCALKTGRRVIYIYLYEKFDFSLNQHTKSDINILGLTHRNIDSITPSELLTWVSAKSTLLIELPHPKALPYLALAKSRGLKTVFELIDDWETNLGGDWFEKNAYLKFVQDSDVVIGTATILVERLISLGRKDALYLPNAANEIIFDKYKSFNRPSDLPSNGKKIALYFGSLYGEWFAWDYIIEAGNTCKNIDIVLIGDNPGKTGLPSNVHFLGAKKIDELPSYLFHADVALLPFSPGKISDAVSPIKVFEYLFMGKPVISTDIPEIRGYSGVSVAKSTKEFAKLCSIKSKIKNCDNNDLFISNNSWFTRLDSIVGAKNYSQFSKNVSAIILIHNNINIIERCIESLLCHGKDFLKEIIVVDNDSSDGGAKLIEEKYPAVRVVRNPINGCSSGRNLAASLAKGKYFAFFDSDQWLTSSSCFVEALSILERDACIGAVGWAAGWFDHSRTDLAGVITEYISNRGMNTAALVKGYRDDIGYLGTGGFFILKKTYDSLSGFDTFYDPTCFEDTDLSFQIKNLGLKICFRDLTGIRHQPHQTTSANAQSDQYKKLFDRNSQYFKSKWQDYPHFFVEYPNH